MAHPANQFSAPTRAWFDATFAGPTNAQTEGWAAIGRGDHTLILAPTGSGKTLAAFLWTLDRLLGEPAPVDLSRRCRVLYVSPLKALSYDVERNLQAPLAGIAREAQRQGVAAPDIAVATRTGDTPAADRRRLAKHPPDILITTPESLYLLLTSQAAGILDSVEYVIVDEVHSLAGTKRGAHLALSLERLEQRTDRPPQRIGLSATQRPLEEMGRWLGGPHRAVTIVDAGVRKPLELQIVVPVEDMGQLSQVQKYDDDGANADSSIWPSVYPRLLELIQSHGTTLVFVNSRRLAERLAARLNELAAEQTDLAHGGSAYLGAGVVPELVRAHHGSIAREQRLEIEEALKAGRLPALIATSSLELGIDMGAIDLVIQVEAPTSVASGLQRIGRAGHQVGQPSRGRIFPKFRHDLLVAAVVAQRMHAGQIEETHVPQNTLDVLAQQIVAMVAAADNPVPVEQLAEMVGRAYPYADLSREALEGVLDMLAGRYPSDEFAELRPRINWDRVAGTLSPRPGARLLAVTSGGTIPDRGLYGVYTPGGGRVGELDEEMVYESRVGETFLLGATTWRIEEITRDRVTVTPAPGLPGKMPFWHGDSAGRPYELGRAIGAFTREVGAWSDERLAAECDLDELAVRNLRGYLDEEREATGGLLPTDRQLVVERFQDELGDWRIALLSPFGARVHAPWALAIEAKVRDGMGLEAQAIWSDDGIIVRLPELEEPPSSDLVVLDPDEIEDLVVGEVGRSALFAARFRENAARALLLPRRRPGTRTPLWQQRQRAADLLAVAAKYGSFPILLETYRECLSDVFDLPALVSIMADVRSRRVRLAAVDTPAPSPFASSLAYAYVAQFMYEGDAPLAERRAQALTLDRRMLADLVGSEELRDLLDPGALAQLEAELQALDERRWARTVDGAADWLRRLGDLTPAELAARCVPGVDPATLIADRRALSVDIAGEPRLIAAEDAGRYRDALGVTLPDGVPDAFLTPVPDALVQLVRRWARTHGPFVTHQPATRFGLPPGQVEGVLVRLQADGQVERGEFRPDGLEREWCDLSVLRVLRQRSLAALRREVEPTTAEALARFLPVWHGIKTVPVNTLPVKTLPVKTLPVKTPSVKTGAAATSATLDQVYDAITRLQGFPIPASVLERDVLPARVPGYSPRLLDELLAAGEVMWIGAGPLGHDDGKVVLAVREQAGLLLPRLGFGPGTPSDVALDAKVHGHLRAVLGAQGACFFRELGGPGYSDGELLDGLWDLVWVGEVTNDSFAAVRATVGGRRRSGRSSPARASRARRPRMGSLSALGPPRGQGRWTLVEHELRPTDTTAAGVAVANLLLERHGVLTRDAVRSEGVPGGFAGLYPVLRAMEESGRIRRGYFVAGLGGAQFALPGAVDRLRAVRETKPTGKGAEVGRTLVLAATDPANGYGMVLPWPVKGPQRVAGAYVVLRDGTACLYVERGGNGVVGLRGFDGEWEESAVEALANLVASGRWSRLALRRYPDQLEPYLRAADFVPSPKGLVRYG
jgi:ATP-dependent Lhr-like helicase